MTVGNKDDKHKQLFISLREEAEQIVATEPFLKCLLTKTILNPEVKTFNDMIAFVISHRLSTLTGNQNSSSGPDVCPKVVRKILSIALDSSELEMGHTMSEAVQEDAEACVRRDPACESVLEVILYFKGFAALVCHRAAKRNWKKVVSGSHDKSPRYTKHVALWLQSQASAAFGVDIHPAAQIGKGVMFDHGTGIVMGETAVVGDGCTILHGVTLGGTGKESGDRHPKVGQDVLIGAGASILGNISIGDGAKIGSGSIVLKPIPCGATAVGSPAKIIGWAKEKRPGSAVDLAMMNVNLQNPSSVIIDGEISTDSINDETTEDMNFSQESGENDSSTDEENSYTGYFCPWTNFNSKRFSGQKPACERISLECLSSVLKKEKCSDAQIGEIYSNLIRLCPRSALSKECFVEKFSEIALKYTQLEKRKCDDIANFVIQKK